jgi:Smg protein
MKENVIDVLMFLFDNYLSVGQGVATDEETLTYELCEAGFEVTEINKAFDWLEGLIGLRQLPVGRIRNESHAIRVYTVEEEKKLDRACRGFLMGLEQGGVIDPMSREIVIDRAMAIEIEKIKLPQFKRIVGLIMMSRTSNEDVLAWLEDLVYEDVPEILH